MRIKKKYLQEKMDAGEKAEKAIEDMVNAVEDELNVNEPEAKEFVKNYVIGSDVSESEDFLIVWPFNLLGSPEITSTAIFSLLKYLAEDGFIR